MRIAIVEDSRILAEVSKAVLNGMGHEVTIFLDGKSFFASPDKELFHLYLLDWALPDIEGSDILKWIRSTIGWSPLVMFVTAASKEEDVVDMLRLGADDYMTKPVRHLEMMARVEVLFRRGAHRQPRINLGSLAIDLAARRITRSGLAVELTPREFELAILFASNIGRVLSRDELLEQVWHRTPDVDTRTVDTHVSRLRKKLGLVEGSGLSLQPVYGRGYRFDCNSG